MIVLLNSLKSLLVLFVGSMAFVSVITLFPLIGSLTLDHFPIQQVIKDNLKLLLVLIPVSIFISPLLGWASYRLRKKRFLYLLLIGIVGCWLAITAVILFWSQMNINGNDVLPMLMVSIWGIVAYSFLSLPVLVPSILILERWTRKKPL